MADFDGQEFTPTIDFGEITPTSSEEFSSAHAFGDATSLSSQQFNQDAVFGTNEVYSGQFFSQTLDFANPGVASAQNFAPENIFASAQGANSQFFSAEHVRGTPTYSGQTFSFEVPRNIYKMRGWRTVQLDFESWLAYGVPNTNNPSGQPITNIIIASRNDQ